MMNHEFKSNGNLVEAIVNWKFSNEQKCVKNNCKSLAQAHQYVINIERKLLVDNITKYINHRTYMYENNFTLAYSISKATSLAKIKTLKELLPGLTFESVCKTILMYKDDLVNVMPASKSKYYKHDAETLLEIFNDCKNILSK